MITQYFAAFDPVSGRITGVTSFFDSSVHVHPLLIKITKTQARDIQYTHRVDITTRELVLGALPDPHPPTLATVRAQRDALLVAAGVRLAEYSLADSFPKMTAANREIQRQKLIVYRQALRDTVIQVQVIWPDVVQ